MTDRCALENISVVLHSPHIPENIGAAARAMCNMGISDLVVVRPENFDLERVRRLATHVAAQVVDRIRVFDNLREALAEFSWVAGTTARLGGQRQVVVSPRRFAEDLIPISRQNKVALVFGPEDRGLSNSDLRLCHALVNIPTADFASLNLAQAVMVVCYEVFTAGGTEKAPSRPRMASRRELDDMFDQLQDILVRISYINQENPDYWMGRLRRFSTRLRLRAGEVSIIRGICRQIDWYAGKCFREGLSAGDTAESGEESK